MLACETAAYYAAQGMSLLDAVNALYREFGFYRNALESFAPLRARPACTRCRASWPGCAPTPPKPLPGTRSPKWWITTLTAPACPRADVLEYRLVNGAKLMVRPSGTEPKIKVYLSAVADSEAADAINTAMADAAKDWMK